MLIYKPWNTLEVASHINFHSMPWCKIKAFFLSGCHFVNSYISDSESRDSNWGSSFSININGYPISMSISEFKY